MRQQAERGRRKTAGCRPIDLRQFPLGLHIEHRGLVSVAPSCRTPMGEPRTNALTEGLDPAPPVHVQRLLWGSPSIARNGIGSGSTAPSRSVVAIAWVVGTRTWRSSPTPSRGSNPRTPGERCGMFRSSLRSGDCKEDAPHQETADAINPIVPLLQQGSRLPRQSTCKSYS